MSTNHCRLIRSLLYFICLIAIVLAIPLSMPLPAAAEPNHVFTVNTIADTGDVAPGDGQCTDNTLHCSLRAAIREANAWAGDDKIILPAGMYNLTLAGAGENNSITGDLDISSVVTIQGTYYDEAPHLRSIIGGGQLDRVFDIQSTGVVTMTYLWIDNGKVPDNPADDNGSGGGIYNAGTLLLNGCLLDHNKSGILNGFDYDASGGGIFNIGPSLTLIGTTIWANSTQNGGNYYTDSSNGGGIASLDSNLTMIGGWIWQNYTGNGGNGVGAGGGNGGSGGGIYLSGGSANLSGVNIQENYTGYGGTGDTGQFGGGGGHGGGIAVNSGNLTLTGSNVLNNTTGMGGAGANVSGWGAGGAGGGIFVVAGTPRLDNTTVSGNSTGSGGTGGGRGGNGGGIYSAMIPFTATKLTLTNNHTGSSAATSNPIGADGSWGGGLYTYGGSVSINGGTIQGNYTGNGGNGTNMGGYGGFGGGIAHDGSGSDELTNLTISGNWAGNGGGGTNAGYGGQGGGIWAGAPSLTGCTVSGNTAGNAGSGSGGFDGSGGGVYTNGEAYITNSTINGNSTGTGKSNGGGGGVYSGYILHLRSSTVTNNTASGYGGGVTGATARNSIYANNSAPGGPDCGGIFSEGYNLVKESGCSVGGDTTGVLIGVDPQLLPLANNLGPTFTQALGYFSPAVNAANPAVPGSGGYACPATDQRGIKRSDIRCDMGAYESPELLPISGTSGSIGTTDQVLTFTWSTSQPITITYSSQLTTTHSTGYFNFGGLVFHLEATDQNGDPVIIPSPSLTLVVHYTDAGLPPGTDENTLKLYRYDSTQGWVPLTVLDRDTIANTLTISLNHFSEYALLIGSQVKVYLPCLRK